MFDVRGSSLDPVRKIVGPTSLRLFENKIRYFNEYIYIYIYIYIY